MTTLCMTLTAAGMFSLLTGVLEAVRVYAIDSGDPGLARLGLAAMIIGGLSTAAIGLGVLIGRGGLSVPRTVAVIGGWLIIWFPLTVALGIATDRYPAAQLAATASVPSAFSSLLRPSPGRLAALQKPRTPPNEVLEPGRLQAFFEHLGG